MKPVATMGDNCLDRYLPPLERKFVGGNALNVAVGLSDLGHDVAIRAEDRETRPRRGATHLGADASVAAGL